VIGDSSEGAVACSLSAVALGHRALAWHELLSRSLIVRERVPGGVRLTVQPDSAETLKDLVELERQCCPWITFDVSGSTVTVTAHGTGEQVLHAIFEQPLIAQMRRRSASLSRAAVEAVRESASSIERQLRSL
jgi:hypothetical protein